MGVGYRRCALGEIAPTALDGRAGPVFVGRFVAACSNSRDALAPWRARWLAGQATGASWSPRSDAAIGGWLAVQVSAGTLRLAPVPPDELLASATRFQPPAGKTKSTKGEWKDLVLERPPPEDPLTVSVAGEAAEPEFAISAELEPGPTFDIAGEAASTK
jgi:hypothetical protein